MSASSLSGIRPRAAVISVVSSSPSGKRPINWMPSSLRSISTEKRGGATLRAGVTSNASTTREDSTMAPARFTARKRAASFGAVPDRVTRNPSAVTWAQV